MSSGNERWRAFFNSPWFIVVGIIAIVIFLGVVVLAARLFSGAPAQAPRATNTTLAAEATMTPAKDTPAALAVSTETPQASPTFQPTPTSTPTPTQTPTQTPLPTATPIPTPTPTPTPVPLPVWRNIGELGIVEYVLSTDAEAKVEREGLLRLFGTDRVILTAVGRVKVGLDFTRPGNIGIDRRGTAITLTLPAVSVLSVEMLPDQSRIRTAERSWIYSEYEGLELEAMARARQQLAGMVADNESMMSLAEELTQLRLIEYLRSLGFTDINIVFRESTNPRR